MCSLINFPPLHFFRRTKKLKAFNKQIKAHKNSETKTGVVLNLTFDFGLWFLLLIYQASLVLHKIITIHGGSLLLAHLLT